MSTESPPPATTESAPPPTTDLQSQLDQARAALASSERARAVQAALVEARAIDLDATGLLLEQSISAAAGKNAPIDQHVRDLKRRKPHLFAPAAPTETPIGAMSPSVTPPPGASLDEIARSAAATGNRRGVLSYLRARRSES